MESQGPRSAAKVKEKIITIPPRRGLVKIRILKGLFKFGSGGGNNNNKKNKKGSNFGSEKGDFTPSSGLLTPASFSGYNSGS